MTRVLLSASAALMLLAGLGLTFAPAELAAALGVAASAPATLVLQLLGALYLGAGAMNWTARGSRVGGIYARPLALGNFGHFLVGGLALLQAAVAGSSSPPLVAAAVVYCLLAIAFARVLFGPPID